MTDNMTSLTAAVDQDAIPADMLDQLAGWLTPRSGGPGLDRRRRDRPGAGSAREAAGLALAASGCRRKGIQRAGSEQQRDVSLLCISTRTCTG